MSSKVAIECLKCEFKKFSLQDGNVLGTIDLKTVESNLRILTFETDRSLIGKEELIAIVPAVLLSLSSSDKNLRQTVGRFLPNLKDLIKSIDYQQNEWDDIINIEFLKLCSDRLRAIVDEYSEDWIEPWLLLVGIIFTNATNEVCSSKLNYLLSVIEKAFKGVKVKKDSVKTTFHVWERFNTILVESLSFLKVVNTAKILHLLVLPFVGIKLQTADPYKHKCWFHVVEKIGRHSTMAAQKIVYPFLQFLIENKRIFINYKEDIGGYLRTMSDSIHVASNYCSELLRCLELCIEHGSKHDDILAAWTSLCGHVTNTTMDHDYFKKLLNFLKTRPDIPEEKELLIKMCLIANQHKLFDFKSVYFEDVRSAIEEVFPLTMSSSLFREKVFYKLLMEMLEITGTLMQKVNEEEEGCMDPIISMWELMVYVYSDFVDASLDSGFEPAQIDINIITDLIILALTQTLFEPSQNEENSMCTKLKIFLQHLAKKIKTELFSNEFLNKFETEIKSSHISLDNCLWLASLISKLDTDVNLIPLLSILIKSVTGCSQPKIILEFLNILDLTTEKSGLKINFKPPLNYLRKFSSSYEPPYDSQIRQLAHSLLKRVPESGEHKPNVITNGEMEEKKSNVRSPLTVHSNFLSRLSKAEEKKNNKNILAASMFPRGDLEKTELNKENKSIDRKESPKVKSVKASEDIQLSPVTDRFAKSSAFILDNSESSESLQIDNTFEAKVSNFKVSTDLHKTVTPTKLNVQSHLVAGLSPKCDTIAKVKETSSIELSPKILASPLSDNKLNSSAKQSPGKPQSASKNNAKNKYCFLDNNSLDTQDFVFVPPKSKNMESPLTNHQKEMMKKRREEIPALYQDLSQDTQNTDDLSSQENSVFSISSESKQLETGTQELCDSVNKSKENVDALHDEENAVFNGFTEEGSSKDKKVTEEEGENIDLVTEEMKQKQSLSPRRLNFEGICKDEKKEELNESSTRQLARRSTSKYRKAVVNDNSKNKNVSQISARGKRGLKKQDSSDNSNKSIPQVKIDIANSGPNQRRKRPDKPKDNEVDKTLVKGHKDELNNLSKPTETLNKSPVMTRRLRKSKSLNKSSSDCKSVSETTQNNSDKVESGVKNEDNVISELNTTLTKVIEKPKETLVKSDNQQDTFENMDVPKEQGCLNQVNADVASPSSNKDDIVNNKTPPSVETPNRRKRSKRSIQFNEFSPKMLRRGKINIKTSPKNAKNQKHVKRIKLSCNDENVKDELKTKPSKIKDQESDINDRKDGDKKLEEEFVAKPTDEVKLSDSKVLTTNGNDNMSDTTSNPTVNQKLITLSQETNKDVKAPSVLKTSPNRAMKIMELANANETLQINTKFKEFIDKSDSGNVEEGDKAKQEKITKKIKSNISTKFNTSPSRAALILKLAENEGNIPDIKKDNTEPISIMIEVKGESNLKNEEKEINSDSINQGKTSDEALTTTHINVRGKRKSISRCLIGEKKQKIDSSISPVVTPTSKSAKRSSLDGWIIKKEKAIKTEVSETEVINPVENTAAEDIMVLVETGDDSPSKPSENSTQVNIDVNPIDETVQNELEPSSTELTLPETEMQQLEIECPNSTEECHNKMGIEDSPSDSSRWPKRDRRDKKPTDFIYLNTGRRPRNSDNKITPTKKKPKPQKQMDLSPSQAYSYINWPKGDCETWVACEPTPPDVNPASAILKRRSTYNSPSKTQISPNATPRKRVSFLDPVVSKGLLYSKEDRGGKIQHALCDSGKTTPIRKKISETNFLKDVNNTEVVESVKSADSVIQTSSTNSHSTISEPVSEVASEEIITQTGVSVDIQEILVTKEITGTSKVIMEPEKSDDKTEVPEDNEPGLNDSVVYNESIKLIAVESNDDQMDNESTVELAVYADDVFVHDECDVNESQFLNESNCSEEQVDIIEKVVGKVSKEGAACIVEPVEVCSIPEMSSDESMFNGEQDFISISDDVSIIAPLDEPNQDIVMESMESYDSTEIDSESSDEKQAVIHDSVQSYENSHDLEGENEPRTISTSDDHLSVVINVKTEENEIYVEENQLNPVSEKINENNVPCTSEPSPVIVEQQFPSVCDEENKSCDEDTQPSLELVQVKQEDISDTQLVFDEVTSVKISVQGESLFEKMDENRLQDQISENRCTDDNNAEGTDISTAAVFETEPIDEVIFKECERIRHILRTIKLQTPSEGALEELHFTLVSAAFETVKTRSRTERDSTFDTI